MMERIHGFPPAEGAEPRILVLGSMPSVKSLQSAQYYGNPRNHFWPLLCRIFGEPLPEAYEERLALAIRHGIALWDSVQSCVRPGSLDQKIAAETPNDIPGFLRSHPSVRRVCFNGAAAQKFHDRYHTRLGEVEYLLLPSTSPIPRQKIKTLEDKLPFWQEALAAVL